MQTEERPWDAREAHGKAPGKPPTDRRDGHYDTALIKADAERLLAAYLNRPGKVQGTRLQWDCPRCGKEKLLLKRGKGAVGCMNAGCEVPDSTDVLGLIGHLEGLQTHGGEFKQIGALCYRLLGLPDPKAGGGAADTTTDGAGGQGAGAHDVGATRPAAAPPPSPQEHPPAPPETVDRVLRRLLVLCPLEERDTRYLATRGVSEETARTGCFGSISKDRAAHLVRRLAEEFERDELLGVPGFRENTDRGRRLGFTLWGDFLLIPYVGPDGRVATIEGRAVGEKVPSWAGKYTSLRNGGNHLYVFPAFSVEDLVAICEGPMGAIVAAQEGLAVGAIQGVKRYTAAGEEAPLPELAGVNFGGRGVLYVPDVDVKPDAIADVEKHAPRACEWLIARQNGVPRIAMLPEALVTDGPSSASPAPKDLDEWILAEPGIGPHGILSRLFARSAAPEQWSGVGHAEGNAAEDMATEEPAPFESPRDAQGGQAADNLAAGGPDTTDDPEEGERPRDAREAQREEPREAAGVSEEAAEHETAGTEEHEVVEAPGGEEAGRENGPPEDTPEDTPEDAGEETSEDRGGADPDTFERWYAVLEGGPGAREFMAVPKVYRPEDASAGVPSDVLVEDAELQWAALLGLVAALAAWYVLGAFIGWLPGPFGRLPEAPEALTALAGVPQSLVFGTLVAATIALHLRGRRIATRRHLLGGTKD